MSSSYFPSTQITPTPARYDFYDNDITSLSTNTSAFATTEDNAINDLDGSISRLALAELQQNLRHCMNDYYFTSQPNIRVEAYHPSPLAIDGRQDSVFAASGSSAIDWQQAYQPSMPVNTTQRPLKRARIHQRTPSASTVGSTGPASPYTSNNFYPQIANTDYAPNSPAYAGYADQAFYPKQSPTPSQTPTNASFYNSYIPNPVAHTSNAHLAMKGFAIDHHNTADDFPPEIYQSSRHSMSSHGNDSPATPRSGTGEQNDSRTYTPQNDYNRQMNPNVQLFRTESQAYQDELYNPPATYTSTPAKRQSDLLTPHRNLINERLQTANLVRTGSPASAVSRERSPFRDGSPLAPAAGTEWNPQMMNTAASLRQQQKEQADQAEYAQHVPHLQREPTKTISPKDAVLDYSEPDQPSLFQDTIPAVYRQYGGNAETWQNGFVNQPGASFGNMVATGPNQQLATFRTSSADTNNEANYPLMNLPPDHEQSSQIPGAQYQGNSYTGSKMNYLDPNANPEFPAQLTSMESSISEGGPPVSSQESFSLSSMPQRPKDTRAHTGTYTCTYHGCTERFESHNSLQKHKRDVHRQSVQRENTSDDTTPSTSSPRSTESPVPTGFHLSSAAIQARNSQAGPHKCTRINPSTNKPCNTVFSRPYDLTRHEDTIHNNRKQKVRCPMCREEKTFSRNDALTRHMRVVHPEVESFGKRGRRGS